MVAKMAPVADGDLRQAIASRLEADMKAASSINIAADRGVVTLTGFVKTVDEKMAVENVAKQVAGVKAIANDLEIKHSYERTDTEIARDALRAFKTNVCIPADCIKVMVRDGQVILEGVAHWQFQRLMAQAVVRNVRGIRSVTNRIEVRPEEFSGSEVEPAEVIVIGGDVQESGVSWFDGGAAEAG